MAEKKRVFTPTRSYDLQIKIKDLDYTNDAVMVVFVSSLTTAYQVVNLTLQLDPNDIIVDDIFGGEPIHLSITLLREQKYPGPRLDIELMYVSSEFQLTEKSQMSSITQKDRTLLNITTVARKPYKIMNTFVNDVFIGSNIRSIIDSLTSKVGGKLNYDSDGENTTSIDQVCIPPTTYYKIIKEHTRNDPDIFDGYLDQRFGLFDGTPGVFCQYDSKVYIKNLTAKLRKNQTFTIYQLGGGENKKDTEKIMEDALDGNVFYTYDTIITDYSGNAKFAKLATSLRHIVKPKDALFSTVSQELEDIARTYSLNYQAKNLKTPLYIDPFVSRTKYYNEDTGNNTDAILFNSRFGRTISDLSTMSINVERNLPVLNLIDVGECVKFKPKTVEYQSLEGKYILWSSEITFRKTGDWETTARINLIRTNKKN